MHLLFLFMCRCWPGEESEVAHITCKCLYTSFPVGYWSLNCSPLRQGGCKSCHQRVRAHVPICMILWLTDICSIDAKRLETVEAEIKAAGGESLSVAGDVGADDFPKKIVDATVQWVIHNHAYETNSVFFATGNGERSTTLLTTPDSHSTRCCIQPLMMPLTLS